MFLNLWDNFAETSLDPAPKAGFCHKKWVCMGIKVFQGPCSNQNKSGEWLSSKRCREWTRAWSPWTEQRTLYLPLNSGQDHGGQLCPQEQADTHLPNKCIFSARTHPPHPEQRQDFPQASCLWTLLTWISSPKWDLGCWDSPLRLGVS